ncbi:MAG: branched-chain amino acid aminotransferase [Bacteroidetes bacterium]|nr:branched-chain amino acid aminotransferase [Bacteroidota bacterium]
MIEAADIQITKVETSKLKDLELNNVPFGKYFTDHMLEADFENGEWKNVEIKPYQPLLFQPSLAVFHYGQAIFEGIKAYRGKNNKVAIFRPFDNYRRFNLSALRMNMPEIPEEIFIQGIKQLVKLDEKWVPDGKDHALYIRPFMISTDPVLGVKPSSTYKFLIILSPSGPYYSRPMKIAVEEKYTRAAPGGVGYSKNAGNYGGSMLAATKAKEEGYDQVLWTDPFEHKWLQEVGMMNVFFIIDGKAITPSLDQGTILAGITRDSVIDLLQEMNIPVEERHINIDEIIQAHDKGTLQEVFGTGTAATIALVSDLKYRDINMHFDINNLKIAPSLKKQLIEIKEGRSEDKFGWMEYV